jgi:hypothetical protein
MRISLSYLTLSNSLQATAPAHQSRGQRVQAFYPSDTALRVVRRRVSVSLNDEQERKSAQAATSPQDAVDCRTLL